MSPTEVIVLNPDYWVSRAPQLAQILRAGRPTRIGDPSGKVPDPERILTVADPKYWAGRPRDLQEILNLATGAAPSQGGGGGLGAGAAPADLEKLTLTVEEAARVLGISRAFAYESVRRGDIPHIRIGRRRLVPKAALDRLLASANPPDGTEVQPDPS